jgi:hypothetical protein
VLALVSRTQGDEQPSTSGAITRLTWRRGVVRDVGPHLARGPEVAPRLGPTACGQCCDYPGDSCLGLLGSGQSASDGICRAPGWAGSRWTVAEPDDDLRALRPWPSAVVLPHVVQLDRLVKDDATARYRVAVRSASCRACPGRSQSAGSSRLVARTAMCGGSRRSHRPSDAPRLSTSGRYIAPNSSGAAPARRRRADAAQPARLINAWRQWDVRLRAWATCSRES